MAEAAEAVEAAASTKPAGAKSGEMNETGAGSANATAVGSTEPPSLRSESERLKVERDNAQLRAELAALARPWWRKGSIVTTLTAIIAAVVPVTTAVQAHYQKERELALQESKQAHEIRTSYLIAWKNQARSCGHCDSS